MDEKYRVPFVLRNIKGLLTQETANALGLTESAVKVRVLRARLMLRERLTTVFGDSIDQVHPTKNNPGFV